MFISGQVSHSGPGFYESLPLRAPFQTAWVTLAPQRLSSLISPLLAWHRRRIKVIKPHRQYSSSCLLPLGLHSTGIWLQLRREQLGVSRKSRSTLERCQSSGITGLMEEDKKAIRHGERDGGLLQRWVLFTLPLKRGEERRRNDGRVRAEHTAPGREAQVLFWRSSSPSISYGFSHLPHCKHLTPYVFFFPQCLGQTKRKINNAFSPPFPLWCNFKKPMDSSQEAHRGKNPMVRNMLGIKVQEGSKKKQQKKNFTLALFKHC